MTSREKLKMEGRLASIIYANANRIDSECAYNCTNTRAYRVMRNKCINFMYAMKDYRMHDFVELNIILSYISKMSY